MYLGIWYDMKLFNQRDPQWTNVKLGSSEATIGSHGCTITCLGMAGDITPVEVNNRMNSVSGYTNGNLVTWTKVQAAIPWLQFEWRGTSYDNDRVKAAIEKNGFCLVEVDGSRIGGTRHWVLYIGNGQMYDPFYGTQKTTSYYPAVGYAIINKVGEPQTSQYRGYDLSNSDSMKIAVDDHIKVVEGQLVDKSQYEAIKGQLTESQKHNDELSQQLGTANGTIKALTDKVESQTAIIAEYNKEDAVQIGQLKEAQTKLSELSVTYWGLLNHLASELKLSVGSESAEELTSRLTGALQSLLRQNDLSQTKISDLEKKLSVVITHKKPIDSLTNKDLISIIIGRLLKRS